MLLLHLGLQSLWDHSGKFTFSIYNFPAGGTLFAVAGNGPQHRYVFGGHLLFPVLTVRS